MTSTKVCGRITTSCRQMWCKDSVLPGSSPVLSSGDPRFGAEKTRFRPTTYGARLSSRLVAATSPARTPPARFLCFVDRAASRVRRHSTQVSSGSGPLIAVAFVMMFALAVSSHAQPARRNPGEGGSALADRIQSGDRRAALAMIAAGADVNQPQPDGTTPLHWATYRV